MHPCRYATLAEWIERHEWSFKLFGAAQSAIMRYEWKKRSRNDIRQITASLKSRMHGSGFTACRNIPAFASGISSVVAMFPNSWHNCSFCTSSQWLKEQSEINALRFLCWGVEQGAELKRGPELETGRRKGEGAHPLPCVQLTCEPMFFLAPIKIILRHVLIS